MQAAAPLSIEEYERLTPTTTATVAGRALHFVTPNAATQWRVRTLLTKEPCTIEWLDSIGPDDALLDVGANVGMYSIYAGVLRGARVFAFEPESQNFGLLCRNIQINDLQERVVAWPSALSDVNAFDRLHLSQFQPGGSCHSFSEAVDFRLQPTQFPFVQGSIAVRIDDIVATGTIPVPTHIKIDVDGFEHKVVEGAIATLADRRVKSLIIETNPELAEHRAMMEKLLILGFDFDTDQAARASRREGPFKGVGEYVFRR